MDQVQAELAEMRANMAQFMTMMQGVVQGQEELRALAQRQEAVILPPSRASPVGVPGNDNAAATVPVNEYVVGDELRGIRINGQPLAAETVNARMTRAPVRHPAPLVDRQEDMFTLRSEDDEVVRVEERDIKVDALVEKIRAMECQNSLGFDVTNMGLVEGLRILYKFKAPSFDKYNGTSCPRTHLVWSFLGLVHGAEKRVHQKMEGSGGSLFEAIQAQYGHGSKPDSVTELMSKIWRKFQGVRPEMAGISCKGATPYPGKRVDRYVHRDFTRSVYGPDEELPFR
ncbi:hypothetical protein KIW84_062340 [Lathyrus oleraceus]|uniref:Uncharacterized protein n=1 Tax=Pisum sativum TaxID=3888 RepID=A0A9D4W662_PEA|nr:hypothetical protein KIW84_062340 [Pisum sativum]